MRKIGRWIAAVILALLAPSLAVAQCQYRNKDQLSSVIDLYSGECLVIQTYGHRILTIETRPESATGTLTATDNFIDTDEFGIDAETYIAEDGAVGEDEFELGADAEESLANLCALIAAEHPTVTCTGSDDETLTVEAITPGSNANALATTTTSMDAAWGDTTLDDVTDPTATVSPVNSASATEHSFWTETVTDDEPQMNVLDVEGPFYLVTCADEGAGTCVVKVVP